MKEIKLLDRVQAVLPLYFNLILATIQESSLISELACNQSRSAPGLYILDELHFKEAE